ncbi:MAG: chemotaxis protein CheA [Bacteroidales bacterium]|jgi:two-component system chemotaxis sensor kinase CheA|nr:chemotaxis protein CheA [Bacteroidales bacterium]
MDNFQRKFLEEASDLINQLEQALLTLEQDTGNPELVDSIFRIMHSLKGGGGMFGFDNVTAYTHKLENMYDLVRQKKLKVTREMLDITFESADHITSMLNDDGSKTAEIKKNEEILNKRIDAILLGDNSGEIVVSRADEVTQVGLATYYVKVKPYEHIQKNGTNPFFLIDELVGLGQAKVNIFYSNIPDFENFVFDDTYIWWEIVISTDKNADAIRDVFIFVEDDCEVTIEKLADRDIFGLEGIEPLLVCRHDFPFDLDKIKSLVKAITALEKAKNESVLKVKENSGDEHIKKFAKESSISGIRVASEKIDMLMNLVSELITTQAGLNLYADRNKDAELTRIAESLENISRQLRDTAFSITLIPIDYLVVRFRRLVRDLSREVGKEIVFEAKGAETELDKTLIEGISEPLMHILRNSIDHGIESAEERVAAGKSPEGRITLQAYYSGSQVVIAVTDDGAGMNPTKIKRKAIEKGLISSDAQISDKEIIDLIFMPGFSTSEQVTNISGRGVGMDVVKRKVSDIRGTVQVSSQLGEGTTITIKLPLTLSIIDGMLVRIADVDYIIPLSVIDTIFAVEHSKIAAAFQNVINIEGTQYPFYYLRDEFGITENVPEKEEVIMVKYEDRKIGIVVDNITGEYQAVLKPLGKLYRKQDIFSGASILGDGTVALVLDTHKVINQFTKYNELN